MFFFNECLYAKKKTRHWWIPFRDIGGEKILQRDGTREHVFHLFIRALCIKLRMKLICAPKNQLPFLSELLIRLVISLSQQLTKDNRCMSRQVGGVWTSLVAYNKDSQMPSFVDEYLIPKKSKMFIVNNPAIWLDESILNNQNLWSKIFHEKSEIDNRRNTEWKQEKHPRENNKQ